MIKTLKAVISYPPLARINPVPNMYAILRGLVFHSISGYRESVAHLLGVRQPVNGGSLLLGTSVGTIQGVRLRTVWVCLQKKHKNRRCPDRKLLVLQGSRTSLKTAAKLKKSPQKMLLTGMPILAQKASSFCLRPSHFILVLDDSKKRALQEHVSPCTQATRSPRGRYWEARFHLHPLV